MMESNTAQIYDCVIIGGGPAGITAAIYLARFMRSVLILDSEDGRWETHEINENYFGFPDGIPTIELRRRGVQQAKKFGAELVTDRVQQIEKRGEVFLINTKQSQYSAKTILFATGVRDRFPKFEALDACLGKSLFWCITCDGYKTIDKRVLIIGYADEVLTTALQFLNYTRHITVITNQDPGTVQLNQHLLTELEQQGIQFYEGSIDEIVSADGMFDKIKLKTGQELTTDFVFSMQGATPNSQLAAELGVSTDTQGYIISSIEQRTNVPGIYAAGDVTKAFAHQIVTAAHEGATAAQAINYDLYLPMQKE